MIRCRHSVDSSECSTQVCSRFPISENNTTATRLPVTGQLLLPPKNASRSIFPSRNRELQTARNRQPRVFSQTNRTNNRRPVRRDDCGRQALVDEIRMPLLHCLSQRLQRQVSTQQAGSVHQSRASLLRYCFQGTSGLTCAVTTIDLPPEKPS